MNSKKLKVIDALDWMLKDIAENDHYQINLYPEVVKDALKEIKTKVDVVRCQDCKYSKRHYSDDCFGRPLYACNLISSDYQNSFLRNGEWFCADGEQKEVV